MPWAFLNLSHVLDILLQNAEYLLEPIGMQINIRIHLFRFHNTRSVWKYEKGQLHAFCLFTAS